jgi:GH24 family phage-related lysozyme (muramidase)
MVPAGTLKKVTDDLRQFEDAIPYMYLDTVSTVTVGIGTALFSVNDVDSNNFIYAQTHLPASLKDKRAAWNVVQSVSHPRGTRSNYPSEHFEKLTSIVINTAEQDRLLDKKLEHFYKDLVRIYPGFDSMPENAKIALFDMIYNLGPGHLEYKFVQFTKAVRARKWATAAIQSYRPQVQPLRNMTTKAYLESCVPAKLTKSPNHNATKSVRAAPVPARSLVSLPLPPPPEPFPRTPSHKPIPVPLRLVRHALIRQGDQGADVRIVQNATNRILVGQRPPLKLDGKFGPMTSTSVRAV